MDEPIVCGPNVETDPAGNIYNKKLSFTGQARPGSPLFFCIWYLTKLDIKF